MSVRKRTNVYGSTIEEDSDSLGSSDASAIGPTSDRTVWNQILSLFDNIRLALPGFCCPEHSRPAHGMAHKSPFVSQNS